MLKKGQICEGYVKRTEFPNKGIVEILRVGITADGQNNAGQQEPVKQKAIISNDIKVHHVNEGDEIKEKQENSADEPKAQQAIVKDVIEGQQILLMITKVRGGKAEGRCLEILKHSPLESDESCSHFPVCGGCLYQGVGYSHQLAIKEMQVRDLLEKATANYQILPYEGIRKSPVMNGYRNKMEYTFGDSCKGGPLTIGLHAKGGFYDIITTSQCKIADSDFGTILEYNRQYFEEKKIPYFHRMSHEGYLRHLVIRRAAKTGELLLALVTTSQANPDLTEYKEGLLQLTLKASITGILHVINDSAADVVKSDKTEVLYGRDYFYEELLGIRFKISLFSFFQTNSLGAEVLYQTIRDYLGDITLKSGKKPIVYDLYSGTGTIAEIISPACSHVFGVEIIEEAVEAAKINAAENEIHNCTFIAGDVLRVLDEIEEKPDFIILDPPRDGIHPKALSKIIAYGVERIVYVSCKPTSLARDLEVFLGNRYRAERVCSVDMFPYTANVETVVLLSKLNMKQHIDLELKTDELDLTSSES